MSKKFKFDVSALSPESVTIKLNDQTITFFEFGNEVLYQFIDECVSPPQKENDNDKVEQTTFAENALKSTDLIYKYVALASTLDESISAQFLKDLNLPPRAIGQLADMLWELNHLSDLLPTGGNFMVLPTIWRIRKDEEKTVAP